MHGSRQPIHLVTGLKADGKRLSGGLCGPAGRFHRGIDLPERQPGMVEKGLAGGGQLDAMNAARYQVANLPTQRRLRGVESQLGGRRQAAFLDHGNEITQVPQLHSHSMPEGYAPQLTKSFSPALRNPRVTTVEAGDEGASPCC